MLAHNAAVCHNHFITPNQNCRPGGRNGGPSFGGRLCNVLGRGPRERQPEGAIDLKEIMRTLAYIAEMTLLGVFLFCGCGKDAGRGAAVRDATLSPGRLVVAMAASFPPYEFSNGGEMVGVDVDISRKVAEKIGCELEIRACDFDTVIPYVASGTVDMAASALSITDERGQIVDFSIPYKTSTQVLLVKTGSGVNRDNLKGLRIGAMAGSTGEMYVRDRLGTPVSFVSGPEVIEAVKKGDADAAVLDLDPISVYVMQDEELEISGEPLQVEKYGVAVRKGATELLCAVNETIAEMQASGELDRSFAENMEIADKLRADTRR